MSIKRVPRFFETKVIIAMFFIYWDTLSLTYPEFTRVDPFSHSISLTPANSSGGISGLRCPAILRIMPSLLLILDAEGHLSVVEKLRSN